MNVDLHLKTSAITRVTSLRSVSILGQSSRISADISTPSPLDCPSLVGSPVRIEVTGDEGSIAIHHGIIASISAIATANPDAQRQYTLEIRSIIELLTLRKNARVFRKKNAVTIVREILAEIGIEGDAFVDEVGDKPPEREYVTQWNETDAVFLRRICEEDGLFFRFDPKDGFDAFVLCDRSSDAPEVLGEPLPFVDASGLRRGDRVAYDARHSRKRRPGKVTLRDYDPTHPAAKLEAIAQDGLDSEKRVELYQAPGRFRNEKQGTREAMLRLEALRADAELLQFQTTALSLRPGTAFDADSNLAVGPIPNGKYFVIETSLNWKAGENKGALHVKAIPLGVPYRLPRVTPRPRMPGIQSATITGAPGDEIHTDSAAQVRIHFPWDRSGPTDDKSSLPVRVMQANLPGSMLIPRVGWEVIVGFEDGDPDRPYVLGRSFNGKQLPPFGLPANKTITSLGTISSPGGGKSNIVHIDDAAGRQHMVWNAGFGKTTHVGSNMNNQTVGVENTQVKTQTWQVGGDQTISVENAWTVGVGSQTATVSGNQTITIKATGSTTVDTETVLVGGALIENVGNPVQGLAAFAKAAAIEGMSNIPVVGTALSKAASWGNALYEGYKAGGWQGVVTAAGQTAVGEIAGRIPGGDAIVAAADAAGLTPWSDKAKERAAQQQAGGGGSDPGSAGAGAAAAAPGHRKVVVDGAMIETIGALHAIETPGSIKWTTLGASTFAIGGSHATTAARISRLSMITSSDTASATSVQARKSIGRNVKTALTMKTGGAFKIDAGLNVGIKAKGALDLKVGGAASFEGATVVFEVGGSSLSIHGGGVTLRSAQIVIDGKNKHSGKESVG